MAWNTMKMQSVLDRWNARRSTAVPPGLIGRIAPTRTEGINLQGVFTFPIGQYQAQLPPSLPAAKSRAFGGQMALQNAEKRCFRSEQKGNYIQQVTDVPGIFAQVFADKVPVLLARKSRLPHATLLLAVIHWLRSLHKLKYLRSACHASKTPIKTLIRAFGAVIGPG
jgi:hypothetical protein